MYRSIEVYTTDMRKEVNKREQARELRQEGNSIRDIARKLQISTSSSSLWCRDVFLSDIQKIHLAKQGKSVEILKKYARIRHDTKVANDKALFDRSKQDIGTIKRQELFLIGLSLYWAEGFKSKSEKQVGFCNSDPRMIRFVIKWFKKSLMIKNEEFVLRVEFNQVHKTRKEEIENYWSKLTGISKSQFNKPYLQKSKWDRDYSGREKYYGLLRIRIRKSSQLLVQIRGWLEGLRSST
jgi:hypothetical protein